MGFLDTMQKIEREARIEQGKRGTPSPEPLFPGMRAPGGSEDVMDEDEDSEGDAEAEMTDGGGGDVSTEDEDDEDESGSNSGTGAEDGDEAPASSTKQQAAPGTDETEDDEDDTEDDDEDDEEDDDDDTASVDVETSLLPFSRPGTSKKKPTSSSSTAPAPGDLSHDQARNSPSPAPSSPLSVLSELPAQTSTDPIDAPPTSSKAKGKRKAEDVDGAAAGTATGEGTAAGGVNVLPVKKKKKKLRTPSPPPEFLIPKPLPTIRLEVVLPSWDSKRKEVKIWNPWKAARQQGLVEARLGEEEELAREKAAAKATKGKAGTSKLPAATEEEPVKKTRKRKIKGRDEGYDSADSFVDDSELQMLEPKFAVRPARDGYYITSGPLTLADEVGANGRKKKAAASTSTPTVVNIPDSDEEKAMKREPQFGGPAIFQSPAPSSMAPQSPAKKKNSIADFCEPMQELWNKLAEDVKKESFVPKNKFPQYLKPKLVAITLKAIEVGEFDDCFWHMIVKIFPYNMFTMKKLMKREAYPERMQQLNDEQKAHTATLKNGIDAAMPAQISEHETAMENYKEDLEKWKESKLEKAVVPLPPPKGTPTATQEKKEDKMVLDAVVIGDGDDKKDGTPAAGEKDPDPEPQEPKKKFKWNDTMRNALYQIVKLEDQKTEITNEKLELEKQKGATSSTASRRQIYAQLLTLFPADWMTTQNFSTQVSALKKKYEKAEEAAL